MHFNGWRDSSWKLRRWMLLDELIHGVPIVRGSRLAQRICDRFERHASTATSVIDV